MIEIQEYKFVQDSPGHDVGILYFVIKTSFLSCDFGSHLEAIDSTRVILHGRCKAQRSYNEKRKCFVVRIDSARDLPPGWQNNKICIALNTKGLEYFKELEK